MKLPRAIDVLMWTVAEKGDEQSIKQFQQRYPGLAGELAVRLRMVAGIKGSRPVGEAGLFVLRDEALPASYSRLAVACVALLLLASVTFAAYATVQYVNSRRTINEIVAPRAANIEAPTTKTEAPHSGFDAMGEPTPQAESPVQALSDDGQSSRLGRSEERRVGKECRL